MVGAGSVVSHNVPPDAIVRGNPARIVGYAGSPPPQAGAEAGSRPSLVRGVTLHHLPLVDDLRGFLSFGEACQEVPFEIKRYFLVFGVQSQQIRGEHAHRKLQQFLICVHGSCRCMVDDGDKREEFLLHHPRVGLYVPPLCWCVQYDYSPDAVLLVLASEGYDPGDYIRDYAEFLQAVQGGR